ncbi:MAG: OmpA/MotB domain-containing protein [bacterium P3]|nr:MAG: OmpA/MotB domain-containing protein [bacterium P3]KWW40731.1 MAG: OmpA/MotB domain-containing protein [bacterium F083]
MPAIKMAITLLCLAATTVAGAQQYSSGNRKAVRHFEKAIELLQRADLSRAEQALYAAIEADTTFAEAHLQLADMMMERHTYPAAVEHYRAFLRHDKRHKRWHEDALRNIGLARFRINALANPVAFNPVNLGEAVNSADDEYLPAITADGATLIFTRRSPRTATTTAHTPEEEDFYICRLDSEGRWSHAQRMEPPVNTTDNEGAQCISYDGRIMIFTACGRRDGAGRCDLYQSVWHSDRWGKPRNMGPAINTGNWESQPSLSADGQTLFFVSDRPGGYGGTDIWMSRRVDGEWGTPVNLGPVINTAGHEAGPFIHYDGRTLYFSSTGHPGMGGSDLFVSRLQDDGSWSEPENLGYPVNTEGDESRLVVSADGRTAYFASDQLGGYGKNDIYRFELPEPVRAAEMQCPVEIVSADTLSVGQHVTLENIFFKSGSAKLYEESFVELDKVAELLQLHPALRIELEGHTDNVGDEQANQLLSEQRAKAAYDYLRKRGIDPARISYRGYGESQPVSSNDTEEGRRQNRRTVFTIIEK